MAISDIKVGVKFLDDENGVITEISLPPITNNISGSVEKLSEMTSGENIKFFCDSWRDSIKLYSKNSADFIIFDENSDENCNCDVEITITGEALQHISLQFDGVVNEYATEIEVNGVSYVNGSFIFIASGLDDVNTVSIVLKKWSKPNRPIRLVNLTVGLDLEFRHLSSYEFTMSGNEIVETLNYGIAVNEGEITLQDTNNILMGLYVSEIFTNDLPINLYFNNRKQGVFYSSNVDYVLENKELTFELTSQLENFLDENVVAYELPLSAGSAETKTAIALLEEIMAGVSYVMDSETQVEFTNRTYTFPLVSTTTKYDMLNSLLKTCLSVMYENKNGEIVIKYVG